MPIVMSMSAWLEGQLQALEGRLAEIQNQTQAIKEDQTAWAKSIDHQLANFKQLNNRQRLRKNQLAVTDRGL